MDAEMDESFLILTKLRAHIPNFSVSEADFQRPTSHFVINLYAILMRVINEKILSFGNIEDSTALLSVINLNDEESCIFAIYNFMYFIFQKLGYDFFFNLTDLYCPSAKRTKCICKTLLMCLESLHEIYPTASKIEENISSEAEKEKVSYDNKNKLEQKVSEKANSVGTLKTEIDKLTVKYIEIQQLSSKFDAECETEDANLEKEEAVLKQKYDLLRKDEEELEKLQKEEISLQEEIVHSEEIEATNSSINEIENQIVLLEEEVKGHEECLENKESELYAYEEVIFHLNKIQNADMSENEQLHKTRLDMKNIENEISLKNKELIELKALKVKQTKKNKEQKKRIADKVKMLKAAKEELSACILALEENKKHKMKLYSQLHQKETDILEQIKNVDEDAEIINQTYEETEEIFQEACNKIIISTNKTTEEVRLVMQIIEKKAYETYRRNGS